jgi:hypothetical protein
MAFVLTAGVFVRNNRADEDASLKGCPVPVTTRDGVTCQHTHKTVTTSNLATNRADLTGKLGSTYPSRESITGISVQ